MAVAVSSPGVYIQELPSGAPTIVGVPTSVAAFVGYSIRGPVNEPKQLFSFADFERGFGGLNLDSPLSYSVRHFFTNGGGTCWIVRVADGAAAASVAIETIGGVRTLAATATSAGDWGNALTVRVDYATSNPASTFNMTVSERVERNGRLVQARTETHRNLSMNQVSANYAVASVNASSELIRLTDEGAGIGSEKGKAWSGQLTGAVANELGADRRRLAISLDGGPFQEFDLFDPSDQPPQNLAAIATTIETKVRNELGHSGFTCELNADGDRIVATSGLQGDRRSSVRFSAASIRSATATLKLGLANGGREQDASHAARPAPTGSTGAWIEDFSALSFADPSKLKLEVKAHDAGASDAAIASLTVTLQDGNSPSAPQSLQEVRSRIEAALRASSRPDFSQATVRIVDQGLAVTLGGNAFSNRVVFADDPGNPAANPTATLNLSGGDAFANVSAYQLGVGPTAQAQVGGVLGANGSPPGTNQIEGSRADKSGIYALEDVDVFNILNLPGVHEPSVLASAIAYAEERRSMILIDMPASTDTFAEARDWIEDPKNAGLRHRNAAVYFPRVKLADPLQNSRVRSFPNAGVIAGLYARTDNARGVWKAPAGIDARLQGVQALDYLLTDGENGVLNELGMNCLRVFPTFGPVSWGARTLVGADELGSEWKYVPVRRLTLYIEQSLYRGTQFAVFEPNGDRLWSQLRLSVGTFMNNLFRQGAFQGKTPQEAYVVRCDSTTTTQADIDLGIVNVLVGFAALKPAEFVIIQIQQLAGQSQS